MSSPKHPIMVLISGTGTNLQALIDATTTTSETSESNLTLPNAQIVRVISNRKNAYGLTRATEANIPTTYHNLTPYKKKHPSSTSAARDEYDLDLAQIITSHEPKPELVVCAGWMHILSADFVTKLTDAGVAIINLHPALPGQFDGADAIGRAWNAWLRGEIVATGVMVHYVVAEVDAGPVVVSQEVEFKVGEEESELEARMHQVEWGIIVKGTAIALKSIEEKGNGS